MKSAEVDAITAYIRSTTITHEDARKITAQLCGRIDELKKLVKHCTETILTLRTCIGTLVVTVRDGGDMAYPWDSLSAPRRALVVAAFEEMRRLKSERREWTSIPSVARSVYRRSPGGYPSRESFQRYLYDIDITLFV